MPVVVVGLQIMYGDIRKRPILPSGYYYISGPREWLIACSVVSGRRYYVSATMLYRQDYRIVACSKCHQPMTRNVVDERETIDLPQKLLARVGHIDLLT